MSTPAIPAEQKRRRKTINRVVATLFVAASFVSVYFGHGVPKGTTASLVIALIPIPFAALSIWTILWTVRTCDELQRRIQFEALAFAFASTFLAIEILMFVQNAGFWKGIGMPELMITISALYATGVLLAWNRYR